MDITALRQKLTAYMPASQLAQVETAYTYSKNAHGGQTRASGKPYIVHPLAVADILADWRFDAPSVIAALLHDLVEDTPITLEQIKTEFGAIVAQLVDGLSKIERLQGIERDLRQAENFRKLLLAAADDWRVIFIKLADRLHNMRTLTAISQPERRRSIAMETLEIYAPIAGRLGLYRIQEELQNLSFRYRHPHRFRVLNKALNNSNNNTRQAIATIEKTIHDSMEKYNMTYTMEKRRKNLYSIYRKMDDERLSFAQVEDIIGFRLIVEDRMMCYQALGVLHENFVPIAERFKDYIAIPKSNGYQSVHTRLQSKSGVKIDVQIRTRAMHEVAEHGLAAHWMYKENAGDLDGTQAEALHQLSSLVRLHAENDRPGDFMENVRVDLFPAEMYVLTPEGKIITLPRGASALDMAYAIHTEVGDHAERAIINGHSLPLSMRLKSGDQVEIVTNPDILPQPHRLGYVKTARARSRIRHVLHKTGQDEAAAIGKNLLLNALRKMDVAVQPEDIDEASWRTLLGSNNMTDSDALYRALGWGEMLPDIAARTLLKRHVRQQTDGGGGMQPIRIAGAGRSAIHLSPCCHPLPSEPIIGFLRKERGLIIHSGECLTVRDLNRRSEKWTEVQWHADAEKHLYPSAIRLQCHNRPKLIMTVSASISERDINIVNCHFDGGQEAQDGILLEMVVEVHSIRQLEDLLRELNSLPEVVHAKRRVDTPASNAVF